MTPPQTLPFLLLAVGVGAGVPAPAGWRSIADCALLVLVGVTGAGKSTALVALDEVGLAHHLLPDRRDLTDRLIISMMQAQAGLEVTPVQDRKQRFAYTRAYREQYPGGMAYALSQLWIDPQVLPELLLFDGLRGENEVTHAATLLPSARFAVLNAPDVVRVSRLAGRGDPFDQIGGATVENPSLDHIHRFADIYASAATGFFSPDEEQVLLELVRSGVTTASDLRKGLDIVIEERRNYDPAATTAALLAVAPDRTRVVDTVQLNPEAVAREITELVRGR
ncbi:MAG: ATPase [Anaerolineales bacterium]|nr:ATPase [Anaerolineales bacterium]